MSVDGIYARRVLSLCTRGSERVPCRVERLDAGRGGLWTMIEPLLHGRSPYSAALISQVYRLWPPLV